MKSTSIKLLLCSSAIAALGALALEGCSSSDSPSGTGGGTSSGGTSSGGKGGASSGGTSSGGAATGGTSSGGTSSGGTAAGGTSSGGTSSGGTSSGGTSSAGTGGASGSTSSGGAGAGGTAGTAGTGGTGGAGGGGADCTTFCNDEETICKFGAADMAPYANKGACMTACMGFTLGNVGVYPAGPTSGDTFACRRWHLSKAGDTGPAATHCPHTGQISKNTYTTDPTATGPCK